MLTARPRPFKNIQSTDDRFLKEDSWITRNVLRRLAWLAVGIGSILIVPLAFIQSICFVCKLYPYEAIKILFFSILAAVALTLFALVNVIFPSLSIRIIPLALVPARLRANMQPDYNTLNVNAPKGKVDTHETKSENSKVIIRFCGNGYAYQEVKADIQRDSKELNRRIRALNYPDVSGSYSISSANDLVNAGIAQIYHIADMNRWSSEQTAANVQLYGHSLGGGVALQVAKYFKEKYGMDMPVVVDRSFRSISAVVAGHLNNLFKVPVWYGRRLCALLLYAGGDFELDSVAAFKALNPEMVTYINLGRPEEWPGYLERSWWKRLRKYWSAIHYDADPVIPDGSTFTEGIAEEVVALSGTKTSFIYNGLNIKRSDHLVFGYSTRQHIGGENDHATDMEDLQARDTTTAYKIYKNSVLARDLPPAQVFKSRIISTN